MKIKLGRALVAAAGLALLAPSAASASWWDGGYQPARRQPPPEQPPPSQDQPPAEQPPEQPPAEQPPAEQPPADQRREQSPGEQPPAEQPPAGTPYRRPAPRRPGPYQPRVESGVSIYGCENSTLPGTAPVLHKSTVPPSGTAVHPGQEILVEITWRVTDFVSSDLHKVIDCVYVNNRLAPELSGGERPTPNDGHFAYHYFVPADAPPGTVVCDQGFASGPNGEEDYGREVSDVVCFTVEGPPAPPSTPPPTEVTPAPSGTTAPPTGAEAERVDQQLPTDVRSSTETPPLMPPGAVVRERDVLPRTGGDGRPARLAAAALALASLGRRSRRTRR